MTVRMCNASGKAPARGGLRSVDSPTAALVATVGSRTFWNRAHGDRLAVDGFQVWVRPLAGYIVWSV